MRAVHQERTRGSRRAGALQALLVISFLLVGCEPQGYLPCPSPPAAHAFPVPRSIESTIDFELSAAYVTELVRTKLDVSGASPSTPANPADANPALVLDGVVTGADILRVTLTQKVVAGEEQSLIGIQFVPWLMAKPKAPLPGATPAPSASSGHIRIGAPYTLTLKLAPSRSQQGGPIALTFDFVELNNGVGKVTCSSSVPLDLGHLSEAKDVEVLTFIYSALRTLAVPFPDQDINDAVSKIGGAGGQLQGLAWATDGA